jgi:CheY-like chemotaxis protein
LPVLVVDDNADVLQLLQRYSAGTRYRLIGTRDPEQVLSLTEKFSPQVIILDVMMPQVDGWRVLGRLRQHPRTSHIPIIVCTILAQEALALSLGASAFIRKPVTRQVFLAALDHQVALTGTTPR